MRTRALQAAAKKYFTFEYTIKTDAWYRHNVAVFTEKVDGCTLVAQVPEVDWGRRRDGISQGG